MARKTITARQRYAILARCNFACFYCGVPATLGVVQLQIDHVIPVSRGGSDDDWNHVAACAACNAGKSDTSPSQLLVDAAIGIYLASKRRSQMVRECTHCRRPWVPDWDDEEPNDWCWGCIRAWCDGRHELRQSLGGDL